MLYYTHNADMENEMESCNLQLSTKERAVADGIARGLSNKQVAEISGLTVSTVKTYTEKLIHKCHVANRTALAVYLVLIKEVQVTAKDLHANALAVFLFFFMGLYIQVIDSGNAARHQPQPTQMSRNVRREQYDV